MTLIAVTNFLTSWYMDCFYLRFSKLILTSGCQNIADCLYVNKKSFVPHTNKPWRLHKLVYQKFGADNSIHSIVVHKLIGTNFQAANGSEKFFSTKVNGSRKILE